MPEYLQHRRGDETEGFFCRFTFGQFFALLVLEVFTLFFVFYLGARYGRGLLGLDQMPAIAVEESGGLVAGEAASGEQQRVPTTADPEVARMAGDLMARAETPELKDRIRRMIDEAQGSKAGRMPEVVAVTRPGTDIQRLETIPGQGPTAPAGTDTEALPQEQPLQPPVAEARAQTGQAGRQLPAEDTAEGGTPAVKDVPSDTGVIRIKSADNARYSVQIGSYPQAPDAKKAVELWKGKGYPAYLMIADIPDRGRWYRVRIGGFESREEAARYLKDFSTKEGVEALVVLNEQ